MTPQIIRTRLQSMASEQTREALKRTLPEEVAVWGVKMESVRTLAKEIVKAGQWKEIIHTLHPVYLEEKQLLGLCIAYPKMTFEERLPYLRQYIAAIDCWSVCDVFIGALKLDVAKNKENYRRFILPLFTSENEYEVRFAYVMERYYFIKERDLQDVFAHLDQFQHTGYYASMGAAWTLAMCYRKYPHETIEYLRRSKMDDKTFNMALLKIRESLHITAEERRLIKSFRKRNTNENGTLSGGTHH